jgi:hypothetical protein
MAADGERNFLPIVAIVVFVLFVSALTSGFVIWRRQHVADSEARAPTVNETVEAVATTTPPPPVPTTIDPEPTATSDLVRRRVAQGTATLGTPETAIPNAEQAIAKLRPGFRSCYNKELAKDPSVHGAITLSLVVNAAGDVTDVTKKSGGITPDLDTCLMRRARNATFDSSASGGTVSVPISFVKM